MQHLGIHHWFGAIVTSEDVVRQKPAPDIFLEAARQVRHDLGRENVFFLHVSLLPYFGLASGFLTGKYRSPADFAKSPRGARMGRYLQGKGLVVLAALDAVAARHEATCAQIALAWVMAKPAIAAPIASATSVAQLDELMGALEIELTATDLAQLDQASA